MRAIKYRELKRMYEVKGPNATCKRLQEALEAKELAPEDFSIRELAEVTLGVDRVKAMDPRGGSSILEAGDGVDSTAFSNITGQLLISKVMDAYTQEAFVMSGIIPTIPTRLSGERIPGIGKIKDETPIVDEGMPYEHFGIGEDYVDTPHTTKRGFIVPVTKEAIFFDRTGLLLQRASQVGEVMGTNKEKRILDVVLGIVNNYNWLATAYDTYQAAAPWINVLDEELVDWTDIDHAEQLFNNMLDPNTGEPVSINGGTILVMPPKKATAQRIINATEVDHYSIGDGLMITKSLTPIAGYRAITSRLAYRRLIAAGLSADEAAACWYMGDFAKAFAYMENWPITVTQAPANSEAEFTQDIVVRYKVSERGVAAVMDPRFVIRNTGGEDGFGE